MNYTALRTHQNVLPSVEDNRHRQMPKKMDAYGQTSIGYTDLGSY
jgi:hypothetical protein